MSRQQKVSQSYSLKKSTVGLVNAAATRDGLNVSAYVEKALRFYALSHGPAGIEEFEAQARSDENELVNAEGREGNAA